MKQVRISTEKFIVIAVTKYLNYNNINDLGIGLSTKQGYSITTQIEEYTLFLESESVNKDIVISLYKGAKNGSVSAIIDLYDSTVKFKARELVKAGVSKEVIEDIAGIVATAIQKPIFLEIGKATDGDKAIEVGDRHELILGVFEYAIANPVWSSDMVVKEV